LRYTGTGAAGSVCFNGDVAGGCSRPVSLGVGQDNVRADIRGMETTNANSRLIRTLLWITIGLIAVCLALPAVLSGRSPLPLLIGLLALAAAIAIPVGLGRWRPVFMAAWLTGYVVVYGVLSWRGGYIDGNFGGSDNRRVWYPAQCGEAFWSRSGRQKCYLRPVAWFFLPPLLVDRFTVHRTQYDAY
jgi:hypothetical protein